MRIFLIVILIIFINATLVYGIRPSAGNEYSEAAVNNETAEVAQEKEKIMENIKPARMEREKKLHPFVEPLGYEFSSEDSVQPVQYTVPREPERIAQNIKPSYPKSASKPGVNFTLVFLIVLAFLLSYFFIRPKSR